MIDIKINQQPSNRTFLNEKSTKLEISSSKRTAAESDREYCYERKH